LNGQALLGGQCITTVDALGQDNGKQVLATPEQVQQLIHHLKSYQTPSTAAADSSHDLRIPLRRIEQRLLHEHAGYLIGNQCLDFQKQDGVTEMEEAIMANTIERRLNDLLLRDEELGRVHISRKPIHVSCVSNFTNFLDLFRKTIRSLEVGIPCVILGRSNTVQHSYRWTKLLLELMMDEKVDPGMLTYLSCSLEDIKTITQTCRDSTGNLYATCSRELAASIKSGYPNTVASTGGPNTLVVLDGSAGSSSSTWTEAVQAAIRCSATIESSGQCTALRHVVVAPSITDDHIQHLFDPVQSIPEATKALQESCFDGVFAHHKGSVGPNDGNNESTKRTNTEYQSHPTVDACYKIVDHQFPSTEHDLPEYWRKVVVDVSRVDMTKDTAITELASWLNTHQPIALAVNGATKEQAMTVGLDLFERTGLVVNTIGTVDHPAMTCQARPQEAEVFGEFPPRRLLTKYTKFPVVVPSSTPSYDASYTIDYLKQQGQVSVAGHVVQPLIQDVTDDAVRGFCITLWQYLQDSTAENPKRGFGTSRTAMWGLQRPPLGTMTYLRCGNETDSVSWDAVAPQILLFFGTNAHDQLTVSIPSPDNNNTNITNSCLLEACQRHGIRHVVESSADFSSRTLSPGDNVVEVVEPTAPADFPMVGQFVSTLFPLGHVKITQPNDEEFVERVRGLKKWLKTA
jgi:hypothetical protein